MQSISYQTHTKETYLLAISKMLERASYYGFRAIFVLYLVDDVIGKSNEEALEIYGLFAIAISFTIILGGLLGDLVLGNKNAMLIGSVLQIAGCISMCVPSINPIYVGLIFIALGSGIYTPNLTASFGKHYMSKVKLLDSGFTLLYFAINCGAAIGVVLVGLIADQFGWNSGFISAAVLMLLSGILLLFVRPKEITELPKNELSISHRALKVVFVIVVVGLFWTVYQFTGLRIFEIQREVREASSFGNYTFLWTSLNFVFFVPVALILIVLWTRYYSSPFLKLTIGCIVGMIGLVIFSFIPEFQGENYTVLFFIGFLCTVISEIYVAPIIDSVIARYSNPKYLAIIYSVARLPTYLFSYLIAVLSFGSLESDSFSGLLFGLVSLIVISSGLITYLILNKRMSKINV